MRDHKNAILRPAVSIQFYGIIRWGNIGIFHAKNLFEGFPSLNQCLRVFTWCAIPRSRYLKGSCLASQWLVRALCKCAGKHEMGLCSRLSIQTQEHYEAALFASSRREKSSYPLSRNLDVSKNAQPNEHSAFIFRLTLQSRLRKGINTKIAVRTKVTHWSETDFLVDILG